METLNIPGNNVTVSAFILPNHNRNIEKLKQTLNNHCIIRNIQGITIPSHDMQDSFCWNLIAQEIFLQSLLHGWHMIHNPFIILIGFTNGYGRLILNSSCPLCLDDIKSIDHLFKECCMTKKFWDYKEERGWILLGMSPDQN